MYYRWTEAATNLLVRQQLKEETGKWYRKTYRNLEEDLPFWYHLTQQGYIETKDESSSPKQLAQRRMWQLAGRLRGLMALEQQLAKEISNEFPSHFKNISTNQVMGTFYTDVNSLDTGLLLKKYYPDLYKTCLPT